MSQAQFNQRQAYSKKEWKEAQRFVAQLNPDWLRETDEFPEAFHHALGDLQERMTVNRSISPNLIVAIMEIVRDEYLQERLFPELFRIGMPLVNSSTMVSWVHLVYRYAHHGGGRGQIYDMMSTLAHSTLDWQEPFLALRAINNLDMLHRDYTGRIPLFLVTDMGYGGAIMRSVVNQMLIERLNNEATREKARMLISVCGVEFIEQGLYLKAVSGMQDGAFQQLVHSRKQVYELVYMLQDRTMEHFTGSEDGWEPVQ